MMPEGNPKRFHASTRCSSMESRNACEVANDTTLRADERQRIIGPTSALSVHRSLARTNSARNAFVACTVNIAFPAAL
jgi:hypothetical protein